jgi:hypothetical protein
MSRDACPIDPTDPTPRDSTEPLPASLSGLQRNGEFCNEKEKVRTPDGQLHHEDQLSTPRVAVPRLRLTKTVTCADSLVTADNRALNELGPYWKRASDASLTVYRA